MLYIRTIFTTLIGLYTTRVVLHVLGVIDYGVYGLVGGVVSMLAFLNATMSSATSRFITFELGNGNTEKLSRTFSSALLVHIIIACLVVIICETVGLWWLNHRLVIPSERKEVAFWVFQFSIISSLIGITQVPYNATIIAHEAMSIYTYLDIISSCIKLGVAFLVKYIIYDKLLLYSLLLLLVSIGIRLTYRIYCHKHFPESHFRLVWDREILKPMISFSIWELLGHFGFSFRYHGNNIVLNMFFGPIVNSAYGIASTVQGTLNHFSNNITLAVKPQIVKNYSANNYDRMHSLMIHSIHLIMFLVLLFTFPVLFELPLILSYWLEEVPDHTVAFCRVMLFSNILSSFSTVVYSSIQAVGELKETSIIRIILCIITPILSYIVFFCGVTQPVYALLFFFIGQLIQGIADLFILHNKFPSFDLYGLLKSIIQMLIIMGLVCIALYVIVRFITPGFLRLCLTLVISSSLFSLLFLILIFDEREKEIIVKIISSLLSKLGFSALSKRIC